MYHTIMIKSIYSNIRPACIPSPVFCLSSVALSKLLNRYSQYHFIHFLRILFIYLWLYWVFIAPQAFSFSFFFIYFYQLEANYFTILQWFLPYTGSFQLRQAGLLSSCGMRTSLATASLVAEHRLQDEWASVVMAHGLSSWGPQTLQHRLNNCGARLNCSEVCRTFPEEGWNQCLLHRQADSLPRATREAPLYF